MPMRVWRKNELIRIGISIRTARREGKVVEGMEDMEDMAIEAVEVGDLVAGTGTEIKEKDGKKAEGHTTRDRTTLAVPVEGTSGVVVGAAVRRVVVVLDKQQANNAQRGRIREPQRHSRRRRSPMPRMKPVSQLSVTSRRIPLEPSFSRSQK